MGFSRLTKPHTEQELSSLNQFLNTVFHSLSEEELIFCTSHNEQPSASSPWPYRNKEVIEKGGALNTYHYCISTVNANQHNTISRKDSQCYALHVVVLDDIGTKAEENPLAPSYIIETSKNNFQWGYVLDKPITDKIIAKELIRQVYSKGHLTDRGGAMINKLVKLPIGMNLKQGKDNFKIKLIELNDKRYSVDELCKAWNINVRTPEIVDGKLLGKEIEDELFEWLKSEDRVTGDQGDGWFEVECPMGTLHSDGNVSAGYSPLGVGPDPLKRQFKCFHEHDGSPPDTHEFLMYCKIWGAPDVGPNAPVHVLAGGREHLPLDRGIPMEHFPDLKVLASGAMRLKKTHTNLKYLMDTYGFRYSYNQISKKTEIVHEEMDNENSDNSNSSMYYAVASQCAMSGFEIGVDLQHGYIDQIAMCNQANPVVDFLRTIKMDDEKTDYIAQVIEKVKTTKTTPRHIFTMFFHYWLIQCCAAADGAENTPNLDAKQKYESVLVFTGGQGVQKTKFWNSLIPRSLGKYFQDGVIINPSDKDSILLIMQNWIVEWGEIDATFRKTDLSHIKAFLSQGKDVLRPPYGRVVNDYKRRTSFCASVNGTDFLNDMTGNRRFWPVEVESIELPDNKLVMNMWAQAWRDYMMGEKWWIDEQEIAVEVASVVHKYHSCHDDPDIASMIEAFGRLDQETMLCLGTKEYTIKQICDIAGIEIKRRTTAIKIRDYIFSCVPTHLQNRVCRSGSGGIKVYRMPKIDKKF